MAARPPGLAGPASAPPAEPPPPAPPGLWQAQAASAAAAEATDAAQAPAAPNAAATAAANNHKQREISSTISSQVSRLLEQARVDTENKVKMELKNIHQAVMAMDGRLDQLIAQLDAVQPPSEPQLDAEHVGQVLSKIEQQWGQEIRTLKEELHQTILAHNHNADLIKHHKDTIDVLRERCARMQSGATTRSPAEIQAQLARLEALPKQQQTQQKMEPLFERVAALERKVTAASAVRSAAWRGAQNWPGMPMMAPGMRPPAGLGAVPPNAALMAAMGAAGPMGKGAGGRLNAGKGGNNALNMAAVTQAAAEEARAVAMAAAMAAAVAGTGEEEDATGMADYA